MYRSKSTIIATFITYAFQGLAILLTVFRLWYRWRIQRLWWEDAWAALALLFATIYLVSNILEMYSPDPTIHLITSWLVVYTFTTVIWAVRVSMVLSIVRMMPPTKTRRLTAIIMVTIVTLISMTIVILKVYLQISCACNCVLGYATWTTKCTILEVIVVCQFCGGCVADIMLLVVPLRLLRDMNIPSNRRRMIAYLFSSSILLSIASVFNSTVQLARAHYLFTVALCIEAVVSLVVCNLLVIVTFIYRTFQKELGRGSSDYSADWSPTKDIRSSPLPLTTIELDIPTASASCMTEVSTSGSGFN